MRDAGRTYLEGAFDREPFLRRARTSSKVTIPSLVPDLGHNADSDLPTPYQGLGAQGVNNLASKLLLSLFPPTQPFFRLVPQDPEALRGAGPKVQQEVEEGLTRMEKVIASEFEVMALRVKLFEALKHLLIAGNVCLHVQADGSSRVLGLEQYVARRSPMGWLECLVTKEELDRETLPPDLEALVSSSAPTANPIQEGVSAFANDRAGRGRPAVCLHTCVEWDPADEKYHVHQTLEGKYVPDSAGSYRPELLPYLVLRYATVDGEDYGRGMVEEIVGDLLSLEGLMKAILEAAAISARLVGLVDPAGAATADDLNNAPNGAFVVGRATDVTYPQVSKNGDLQVAFSTKAGIEERLARAFLLNTAVQRNAERVTAEEIRYVAQELESTLGGVFSVLSQELQLPLVQMLMDRLTRQKRIQKLPPKTIRPAIVTGVEALGRGQELAKINVATQAAASVVGPEALAQYINARVLIGAIFTAAGVDTTGLVKSEAEVAEQNRQAQMMAMAQRVGPNVVNQLGPGAAERMGLGPSQGTKNTEPPKATPA